MSRGMILLAAAAILGTGCDSLLDNPTPEQARLLLQGESGKEVRIIVSTEFVASVNEARQTQVVLFTADTVITTLPFERTFEIDDDQRFFAETAWLDTDLADVRMEVYIDERRQFGEGGELREGQPYRFVYTFNQPITREIVVL